MIRVVLFDIDGTLIRTGGAGMKAFEKTFESEFKIPRATQQIKFSGRTDYSLVRECFRNHSIEPSPENFDRFFESYVFWLQDLLEKTNGAACPGSRELIHDLERLPEPPLIGLLTGNIRLGAEIKLRHFEMWRPFRIGAFGDDHEDRNKLGGIARKRAQDLTNRRIAGHEVLVVGDTPLDIECARAFQAKSLAVSTGVCPPEELRARGPTLLAEDLSKVTADEVCAV